MLKGDLNCEAKEAGAPPKLLKLEPSTKLILIPEPTPLDTVDACKVTSTPEGKPSKLE